MPPKPSSSAAPRVDHFRSNRLQLAEAQALNKERVRQDEASAARKAQIIERQRAQYAHAGSRVFAPVEDASAPGAPAVADDVEIQVFVRECEPDGSRYTQIESAIAKAAAAKKQAQGGSRQPLAQQPQQQSNAPSAGRAPPAGPGAPVLHLRRGSAEAAAAATPAPRGQVPQYLQNRKAEMEAEKAEARRIADLRAEQAKYPPGHRPVGEDERAEILDRLAKRKVELENDLGRLPMRFDTQAIATRRKQIETEMQEVEAAQRKFSVKKQLFVPI